MFKEGDCVEYLEGGEQGIVVAVDHQWSHAYHVSWTSGAQTWEKAEDLRNVTPVAIGDLVTLTAEVFNIGNGFALVRIQGDLDQQLIPIALTHTVRKG